MPILVSCAQCQHSLQLRDEMAGKKGLCPKCQAVLIVPVASGIAFAPAVTATPPSVQSTTNPVRKQPAPITTAPAKPAAKPTGVPQQQPAPQQPLTGPALRAAVMSGFRGTFPPVPTTQQYKLGIVLTAGFMAMLPVVYLGFVLLVGAAVLWHLSNNHVMLHGVRGRGAIVVLALYLAPAIVGTIMVIFMFKPFFARSQEEGRIRSLTPQSDPLLFEFVNHICGLVGASQPKRIDVDCDINASASFRNGWFSLFSDDMVLRIGLPLAAGLSLPQFAGIVAHEFGHFSQGFGMRLTYVIHSVNFWFMRTVYGRDTWDAWLQETAAEVDLRIGWILYLAMGGIWISRRVLWLLMYLGHLVTGFMMRQMEFDADRYQARLVGSEAIPKTLRQVRLLGVAWQGAQVDLSSYAREGRLADNLPRLLMSNMQQLPKEAYVAVDNMIAESTTSLFSTHPSAKDRIASARAEQAPGVFFSDLPATVLFGQFDATARGVTEDYYRSLFGPQFNQGAMHSTETLLTRTQGEVVRSEARDRFFAGAYSPLRPLRLPPQFQSAERSGNYWKEELVSARNTMEQLAPACREAVEKYDTADTQLLEALAAHTVLTCGVRIRIDALKRFGSDAVARQHRQNAQITMGRLGNQLEQFEDAAGRRLRAALYLLENPAVAGRVPEGASLLREGKQLMQLAHQVANIHASLLELRNTNNVLGALLGHFEGNRQHDALVNDIIEHTNRVHRQLSELKNQFTTVDYPFDHADGQMSVSQFLIRYVPPRDDIGAVYEAGHSLGQKLAELNTKLVGRLCTLAEAVEGVFKLEPLPGPAMQA